MPRVAVGKKTLSSISTRSKKVATSGIRRGRTTAKSVTTNRKDVVPDQGRETPAKEVGRQGYSRDDGGRTPAPSGVRTRRRQAAVGSYHLGPSDSIQVPRQERAVNPGRSTSATPDFRDHRRGTEHSVPEGSPYSTRPRQPTPTDVNRRPPTVDNRRQPAPTDGRESMRQPTSTDGCQPICGRQTPRSTLRHCQSLRSPSVDTGFEREPVHRGLCRGIARYRSPVREESPSIVRVDQPRRQLCQPTSTDDREPMRQPTSVAGFQPMRADELAFNDGCQPTCNRRTPRSTARLCRALRSPSVDTGYQRLAEREEVNRYAMDGFDDMPTREMAAARRDPRSSRENRRDIRQFHSAEELYSPEVQRRRGGVMTMMEPYKADSSVEGFIQRFVDLRILYGWTELEQKVQLRQAMRGPAEHVVHELSYGMSVSEMLNLIRRRFGKADQQERHRTELQKLRQGKMSLEQLHYKVRELLAKAYPQAAGPLAETIARDAFINALESEEVKLRIRTAVPAPETLEQVVKVAAQLEMWIGSSVSGPVTWGGDNRRQVEEPRRGGRVRKVVAPESFPEAPKNFSVNTIGPQGPSDSSIAKLVTQQIQSLREDMETRFSALAAREAKPHSVAPDRALGHLNYKPTNQMMQPTPTDTARGRAVASGACKHCGEMGHWWRNCPRRGPQPMPSTGGASQVGVVGQSPQVGSGKAGGAVYLPIEYQGRQFKALLDTGCERSVVGSRAIPGLPVEPGTHPLYAANGTRIPVKGIAKVQFMVAGHVATADMFVTDAISEIILGYEWLRKAECIWDFKNGQLTYCGTSIPLVTGRRRANVRRIYASERLVLPAQSQVNVPVKSVWNRIPTDEAGWAVEPTEVKEGVLLARTLMSTDAEAAVVRVLNLQPREVVIRHDELLGTAEAVEVEALDKAAKTGMRCQSSQPTRSNRSNPLRQPTSIGECPPTSTDGCRPAVATGCEPLYQPMSTDYCQPTVAAGREPLHQPTLTDGCQLVCRPMSAGGCPPIYNRTATAHVEPLVAALPVSLTTEQRNQAAELLRQNAAVFAEDDSSLPSTDGCRPTCQPACQPTRQLMGQPTPTDDSSLPSTDGCRPTHQPACQPMGQPTSSDVSLQPSTDGCQTTHNQKTSKARHFSCHSAVHAIVDDTSCPEILQQNTEVLDAGRISAAQEIDPDIGAVLRRLRHPSTADDDTAGPLTREFALLWEQRESLFIDHGVLYRRMEVSGRQQSVLQVVMPKALRREFLQQIHQAVWGVHVGARKMQLMLRQRAYWPGWRTAVERYCKECVTCRSAQRGPVRRQGPMQTYPPAGPYERLQIDLTGKHPVSRSGHKYILTAIDAYTRFLITVPLKEKTAVAVADALVEKVFCPFGSCRELVSDQGTEFYNAVMSELCERMHVVRLRTTAYRPQANGVVERVHRSMNTLLSKVVSENQRDWPEWLPAVTAAYNASDHESTGFSPYYLVYGRDYSIPIDLILPLSSVEGPTTYVDYTERYVTPMREAFRVVNQMTGATLQRSKQRYDRRVSAIQLSQGDFAWYYCPRRKANRNQKWRKLSVICLIEARINEVNYRVRTGPRAKPFVAHIDRLQKFAGTLPAHLEKWASEIANNQSIISTTANNPENGREKITGESTESTDLSKSVESTDVNRRTSTDDSTESTDPVESVEPTASTDVNRRLSTENSTASADCGAVALLRNNTRRRSKRTCRLPARLRRTVCFSMSSASAESSFSVSAKRPKGGGRKAPPAEGWQCPFCPKKYTTIGGMRRHIILKHEMNCSWTGEVGPFESPEVKDREMARAKAQQGHRPAAQLPAAICMHMTTDAGVAPEPVDLFDAAELLDLPPIVTVDAAVGPEGRSFRNSRQGTPSTSFADAESQQGTPAMWLANTSTQTEDVEAFAGLEAATFATLLSDDLDPGATAAASLYARRVGGVGSAALRTLDFAAAVAVGAVRRSVHRIVDLLNAIKAAEPDSSRQRGLLAELKNYCEQASERDT